jgi:hypothetical protein
VIRGLWDEKFRPKKSYYEVQQILENLPNIPANNKTEEIVNWKMSALKKADPWA